MYEGGARAFLEVGPGGRLTGLVGQILQGRVHGAHALDAGTGRRPGFFDLACVVAWLASTGQAVDLSAFRSATDLVPSANFKSGLVVPICGANYVRPKQQRPPATV